MSIDRYNKIVNLGPEYNQPKIFAHKPIPNEFDYKRTYITRYFSQKSNDENGLITEINAKTYNTLIRNAFYNVVDLNWVIVGDEAEVKEKNKKSILYASKKMKAIPLYLQNPIQFLKK